MTTKTYTDRSNATRAAKAQAKAAGIEAPQAGVDYEIKTVKGADGPEFSVRMIGAAGAKPAASIKEAAAIVAAGGAASFVMPEIPAILQRTGSAEEVAAVNAAFQARAAKRRAEAPAAKPVAAAKPEKAPSARKAKAAIPTPKGDGVGDAILDFITNGSSRPSAEARELAERAAKGILPKAPDMSAPNHKSWLKRLAAIEALVKAKDVKALRADDLQPKSSSRVLICRYRNAAIVALEAKAEKAAA